MLGCDGLMSTRCRPPCQNVGAGAQMGRLGGAVGEASRSVTMTAEVGVKDSLVLHPYFKQVGLRQTV